MGGDMELEALQQLQFAFDAKHGWNPPHSDRKALFRAINDDLIGIVGEIGEFANIIKRISLEQRLKGDLDLQSILKQHDAALTEELVDVFIYLMRLASHLEVDIEQGYLKKLHANEHRFKRYENPRF
jgi:NTP pyrophosphatase (non-canonical NTP hydrolase)